MRLVGAVLLSVCASQAAAAPRDITIENKTDGVLRGVYATETGDDNWRSDRLQDNIQVGTMAVVRLPSAACRYDVRVLLDRRPDELLFMGVDVCKAPVVTVGAGRGRPVTRQVP